METPVPTRHAAAGDAAHAAEPLVAAAELQHHKAFAIEPASREPGSAREGPPGWERGPTEGPSTAPACRLPSEVCLLGRAKGLGSSDYLPKERYLIQ